VYLLTTCRKYLSSWIKIWSRHSRCRLPVNLSQIPLACGVQYGVFNSLIPEPIATAKKCVAYFLSRSRIRYFGLFPHGVASRNCCAVHHPLGILLLLYILFVAFSTPSQQRYTIAETTSRLLLKSRMPIYYRPDSSRRLPGFGSTNVPSCHSACISGWFVYSLYPQLQQLTPYSLRSPLLILFRHLLDQRNRFGSNLRIVLRFLPPIEKQLTMPA